MKIYLLELQMKFLYSFELQLIIRISFREYKIFVYFMNSKVCFNYKISISEEFIKAEDIS